MNLETKSTEPEIGVGRSDRCIETTSNKNNDLGAGANADSRVDMKFVASDPLSELVWSPLNGPCLRSTDCSFRQPSHNLWAAGPSNAAVVGRTNVIETIDAHTCSVRNDDLVNRCSSSAGLCGRVEELNMANSLSIHQISESDSALDREKEQRDDLDRARVLEVAEPTNDKPKQCNKAASFLDEERTNEVQPLNAVPVDRLESSAENEVGVSHKTRKKYEQCEKGKEQAVSDEDKVGRKANEDDEESYGSVESCSSAGLFSRGKKRSNFGQISVSSTKRIKGKAQENAEFGFKTKQDSSFVNWISNMTKGLWRSTDDEASPSLALNLTHLGNHGIEIPNRNSVARERCQDRKTTGFQSIFQSIYCSKERIQEAPRETGKNQNFQTHDESASDDEIGRREMAEIVSLRVSSGQEHKTEEFLENRIPCNLKNSEEKERVSSFSSPGNHKSNNDHKADTEAGVSDKAIRGLTGKNDLSGKLWISRFTSKKPYLVNKNRRDTSTVGGIECSKERVKTIPECDEPATITSKDFEKSASGNYGSAGGGGISGYGEPNSKSRDVMASMFARRLDAIKHNMPLSTTQLEKRFVASGSEQIGLDKNPVTGVSGFVGEELLDVPKGILDAVRGLRLSRTDILNRWLKSNVSVLNLDGFFLRLRVGKWEEGLGGTGYYVACITGEGWEESCPARTRSTIPVRVGGRNCLVESRYVSNHDFLEEELKAWWCASARNGVGVPREEDLRQKIEDRKMLGF